MNAGGKPDLKQALRPVPGYERAVREMSRIDGYFVVCHQRIFRPSSFARCEALASKLQNVSHESSSANETWSKS